MTAFFMMIEKLFAWIARLFRGGGPGEEDRRANPKRGGGPGEEDEK